MEPWQSGPCTKHSLRPQVEAYHACRGRGRPEAGDKHACECPEAGGMHVSGRGPAKAEAGVIGQDQRPRQACLRPWGIYVHACPRPRASLGPGRRERPRPVALTNVLCMDHPASVSH
eukprot:362959-Chlamydomonas_euryale.AAC.4